MFTGITHNCCIIDTTLFFHCSVNQQTVDLCGLGCVWRHHYLLFQALVSGVCVHSHIFPQVDIYCPLLVCLFTHLWFVWPASASWNLTLKRLGHFSWIYFGCSVYPHLKKRSRSFVWYRCIVPVLWMLMAWCFSTRASAVTMLITAESVSSPHWVNSSLSGPGWRGTCCN